MVITVMTLLKSKERSFSSLNGYIQKSEKQKLGSQGDSINSYFAASYPFRSSVLRGGN